MKRILSICDPGCVRVLACAPISQLWFFLFKLLTFKLSKTKVLSYLLLKNLSSLLFSKRPSKMTWKLTDLFDDLLQSPHLRWPVTWFLLNTLLTYRMYCVINPYLSGLSATWAPRPTHAMAKYQGWPAMSTNGMDLLFCPSKPALPPVILLWWMGTPKQDTWELTLIHIKSISSVSSLVLLYFGLVWAAVASDQVSLPWA